MSSRFPPNSAPQRPRRSPHRAPKGGDRFEVALQDGKATLVSAPGHGIAAPRCRRLIADRPRILERDDRAAHLAGEAEPPL